MPFVCPRCKKPIASRHNLTTHLKGSVARGGHSLELSEARRVANNTPRMDDLVQYARAEPTLSRATVKRPSDPYLAFLYDLFTKIVKNRSLPGYEFERRVDTLILEFLPDILESKPMGWGGVEVVMPEFPVRGDEQAQGDKQHDAADALLHRVSPSPAWVIFELKTDMRTALSKDSQDQLERRQRVVQQASSFRTLRETAMRVGTDPKYENLRERLRASVHLVDEPVELLYLTPTTIAPERDRCWNLTFCDLKDLGLKRNGAVWRLFRDIVVGTICQEPRSS